MALFQHVIRHRDDVRDPSRMAGVLIPAILKAERERAPAQNNVPRSM